MIDSSRVHQRILHKRYWIIFTALSTLWLLVDCRASGVVTGDTPEKVVESIAHQQIRQWSGDLRFLQTHVYTNTSIVLYQIPTQDNTDMLRYQVVLRDESGWYAKECCGGGGGSLASTDELKELVAFRTENTADRALVFGRTLDSEVATITIIFDDGQESHVTVKDNLFLAVSSTARNVCMIQVLDSEHIVLARAQLSDLPACRSLRRD